MPSFSRLAAYALALINAFSIGSPVPYYFQRDNVSRPYLSPIQVSKELGPLLSKGSLIFGPADGRFEDAAERYNTLALPHIQLVVQPAKEADIPIIVKYANKNDIDFLVKNRGHAYTSTVGKFTGIQIDMGSLHDISIQPNRKTAIFQGGVYGGLAIDYLWDRGYVTTTGACACVGMMGPGLGGGHGRYQGHYGLIADNMVSLNVVLADGSAIKVDKRNHPDLFYAMRGAGHNFGIVTSFELGIYPRKVDTWYYHNFVFAGDKLETLFEELNRFHNNGTTPVDMAIANGVFVINPNISTTEPVIAWSFAYIGSEDEAEKLIKPFSKIGALAEERGNLPYPKIAKIQGTSVDDPLCDSGYDHIVATAGLQVYNVTSERKIYDLFRDMVQKDPRLSNTQFVHEGYSVQGVVKVDPASTAFPFRNDYLLMDFDNKLPKGSDPKLIKTAQKWAAQTRDLWNAGQPGRRPSTYMPYAAGYESIESMYGYEPWRLEKLRALKAKYDPNHRFNYYNPFTKDRHY